MLIFLSSIAVLVAVNVVARRVQRNEEEGFGRTPAFQFPD